MLSAIPATMFPDGPFGSSFPAFEDGFSSLETLDTPFVFPHFDEPVFSPTENHKPIISISGSDNWKSITEFNSGSDESNLKTKNSSSPGSDDTSQPVDHPVSVTNERMRRRMLSNRESARRSRMRKQKHLDNLRTQLNRLRVTNRELMNRLRFANHHCQIVKTDNDRLSYESVVLRQRLWDIRQVLLVRQLQEQLSGTAWPCNNIIASTNEESIPQPLITLTIP